MNFCLIGTGTGASMNAKAIKGIKGSKILAVAGSTKKHLALFAKKYCIPRYYQETKEMLEREKPEAVIIASIPLRHWQDILLSKDYCKIIIVEKPIVTDINLIPKIKEIIKDGKISLSVVYQHRYDPSYQKLKELLPEIKDEIYYINLTASNYRGEQYYKNYGSWRATQETSGGGVLMQRGIHMINFLFSLFDYNYSLASAKKFYQVGVETEGAIWADFIIEDKIGCSVFFSRMSPEIKNGIYLYTKKGSYFVNENNFWVIEPKLESKINFKLKEYIKKLPLGVNFHKNYRAGSHRDFLQDVITKNSGSERKSIFLEDALNDVELIDKIYKASI